MDNNQYRYNLIISIIWGFALASIFRKVCKGRKCIIYKYKNEKQLEKNIYKLEKKCYKYNKISNECDT